MSYRDFVTGIAGKRTRGGRGGGKRFPFLKIGEGTNVFRLFKYEDEGLEHAGWNYFNHRIDNKTFKVCPPNTFRDESLPCEICDEVHLLFENGDREAGRAMMAKPGAWYAALDMNDPEQGVGILNLSGAQSQRVMNAVAQLGGWIGEPVWYPKTDEEREAQQEFLACIDKAMDQIYGEKARDIIVTYRKAAAPRDRYSIRLSTRVSKKVKVDEIPNIRETFMRVKGIKEEDGGPKETTTKAPKEVKKKTTTRKKRTVKKAAPKKKTSTRRKR